MNNLLKKFIQILTGGRPMTRIESAFTERVSGLAVNKYVDYKGRWWLAFNPWSWSRVETDLHQYRPFDEVNAHRHCRHNRDALEASMICGCFYCAAIFEPTEITQWTDCETTALCPKCGIDAVIGSESGYSITPEFLLSMKNIWF